MKEINEIISKYTSGKATLEETNTALEAAGSDLRLNPDKNTISPDEVGVYGLLDTGTGSYDKVKAEQGRILGGGVGDMYALCLLGGKTYQVKGDRLEE